MKIEWPIYFRNQLTVGNLNSEVAIVTLWTKKEEVSKFVNKDKYSVIGQLYSRDEGINALIRNCLANKKIRHVIITGKDFNESGRTLIKLFKNGVDDENKIIGTENVLIDKEIPKNRIDYFRNNVRFYDYIGLKKFKELNKLIDSLPKLGSYGDPEIFPPPKIGPPEVLPNEKSGFIVRERFIGDAWLKILKLIMKFGAVKKSEYDIDQKELMNLMVVIEEEDPDKPVWKEFYNFTKTELKKYIPSVITPEKDRSVEYTYGQRMMDFKGVDQIEYIVKKLKSHPFSRRAVVCLWDIENDPETDKPPCLNLVQCLVQENKLFLTAYIRSNDMFDAWPRNAYALRKLQKIIAKKIGLGIGSLTTISCSAHVYKAQWERVNKILKKHPTIVQELNDPRGYFRISVEDKKIKVIHLNPEGNRIDEFEGRRAIEIYREMTRDFRVHDQFHAFDLGAELQKAEIALELGLDYRQDQKLDFRKTQSTRKKN